MKNEHLQEKVNTLFSNELIRKKYFVKNIWNITSDENFIIFILESPYKDEINPKNKYPLAGDSGKIVSKLFGREEPLGRLVNEKNIKNIAIVNVCNIPMDINTYSCDDIKLVDCQFLLCLNWLREDIGKSRKKIHTKKYDNFNDDKQAIKKYLIEKLTERLNDIASKLRNKKIIVIPCGNIAQAFFDKCSEDSNANGEFIFDVIDKIIRHPSRNQWTKTVFDELKMHDIVKNVIELNNIKTY